MRSGAGHDSVPDQKGGGGRQDGREESEEGGGNQELPAHGQVLRDPRMQACRLQVRDRV